MNENVGVSTVSENPTWWLSAATRVLILNAWKPEKKLVFQFQKVVYAIST
jgi:hypothetical protein